MPNLSYTELTVKMLEKRRGKLHNQFMQSSALADILRGAGSVKSTKGGRMINEYHSIAAAAPITVYSSGSDPLANTQGEFMTMTDWYWSNYVAGVNFSGPDMRMNQGESQAINYTQAVINNAMQSLEARFARDVYTGGLGAGELIGLDTMIPEDPTVGVVGGIDRSTDTWWRTNAMKRSVNAPGALARQVLSRAAISVAHGPRRLTRAICGQGAFSQITEELMDIQRITDNDGSKAVDGFGSIRLSLGGTSVTVVLDGGPDRCPDNDVFLINPGDINFNIHPDFNFSMLGDKRTPVNLDAEIIYWGFMGCLSMASSRNQAHITLD